MIDVASCHCDCAPGLGTTGLLGFVGNGAALVMTKRQLTALAKWKRRLGPFPPSEVLLCRWGGSLVVPSF